MGLTCKAGGYIKVLNELLKINIPTRDIFLLYGPIDVLVKFEGFKSLQEFVEKWFNPVRMVCSKEQLITKTMTYIAVIEGPSYVEEPFAFMFLNVQPRDAELARKKLLKNPHVISADFVFGPCDLIVPVRAKNNVDLERVVSSIHLDVSGIEEAYTTIVPMIRI